MPLTKQEINDEIEKLDDRKEEMTDGEYITEMNIIRDAWKLLKSSSDNEDSDDSDESYDSDDDAISVDLEPFPLTNFKESTQIGIFEFYKDIENCFYIYFYPVNGEEEIYMKDWNEKSFKKYISIGRKMTREFLNSIKNTFTLVY